MQKFYFTVILNKRKKKEEQLGNPITAFNPLEEKKSIWQKIYSADKSANLTTVPGLPSW